MFQDDRKRKSENRVYNSRHCERYSLEYFESEYFFDSCGLLVDSRETRTIFYVEKIYDRRTSFIS